MDLATLERMIERATEDGKLSRLERDLIISAVLADSKIAPAEMALIAQLKERIASGEIVIEG